MISIRAEKMDQRNMSSMI